MNTCHGSTISLMTKAMMAAVAITATERAIIMIAHRLSTLEFCDELLVIEDGGAVAPVRKGPSLATEEFQSL